MSDDKNSNDRDEFSESTTVEEGQNRTMIGVGARIASPKPAPVADKPIAATLIAASAPAPELIKAMQAEKAQQDGKATKVAKGGAPQKGSTLVLGQPVEETQSVAEARVGKELGGYHVIRKLAEGGMGVVYEAEHLKIGRKGAIKVLKAEFCQDANVVERFYLEARAVNEIGHENIVDIFDFGKTPEGGVFFVMDFLEGMALSDRLKKQITWSESLHILRQTIHALKAAHAKGFVHRDLKPDNIFLEIKDGGTRVKLLDFGIAKLVGMDGAEDKLTRTGSMIGTPHYMSPEQINGSAAIDHRTDIYSLGIIMYEMFSGATPFQGNTLGEIITGHLLEEPPPLANLPQDLGIPKPIADIIHRMLAKKPDERYDSVDDVLSDLIAIDKDQAPQTAVALQLSRPMTTVSQTRHVAPPAPSSSSKVWLPVAGLGAAALIAGAIFFTRGDKGNTATPGAGAGDTNAAGTDDKTPAEAELDYDAIRTDAQQLIRTALEEAAPGVRVRGSDAAGDTLDPGSATVLFTLAQSDPSEEVRGHAATALGKIGHVDALKAFKELEAKAAAPLQPWYAEAMFALGDEGARKRLIKYAKSKDLAVAFKSAMSLAESSEPGDEAAIAALTTLAAREAELNEVVPYAGALLLSKLAALRSPGARGILYSILEQKDEQARLAAAEGLARLGDDGGSELLVGVVGQADSPNRLRAAVTLVLLGDYSGYDVLAENLSSEDAGARTQAAQGMGYLGETRSVAALLPLLSDKDWNVRVAGAVALVAIVGLDPALLAQASVDWTRSALESEDWATRESAANVLGDMPEKQALPLLAQAIADASPNVRLAAAKSARKLRSPEAARQVAAAALVEKDPLAQEEQVKALGAIGQAESAEVLKELSNDKGRVGVFAAGSLIAVGDASGKERLVEAVADKRTTIRLAAVEAAGSAKNEVVVPVLATGASDKVFEVRFTASEGLATFGAEKALAVPVLESGLLSESVSIKARAQVGLMKFGASNPDALSTDELLDSSDPESRLAAIEVLKSQGWAEARPKVMRLVNDTDMRVRRASVDLLDTYVAKNTEGVKTIYKSLTTDSDSVTRTKAQARLSLLVEPLPKPSTPTKTGAVTPTTEVPSDAGAGISPEQLAEFDKGLEGMRKNLSIVGAQLESLKKDSAALTALVANPAKDDAAVARATKAALAIGASATEMTAVTESADTALAALKVLATDPAAPEFAERLAAAESIHAAIASAIASSAELDQAAQRMADEFAAQAEAVTAAAPVTSPEATAELEKANTAFEAGKFGDARKAIRAAKNFYKSSGAETDPLLMFLEGMLYRQAADEQVDRTARAKLLKKAQSSLSRFVRKGTGDQKEEARGQLSEIDSLLEDLAPEPGEN